MKRRDTCYGISRDQAQRFKCNRIFAPFFSYRKKKQTKYIVERCKHVIITYHFDNNIHDQAQSQSMFNISVLSRANFYIKIINATNTNRHCRSSVDIISSMPEMLPGCIENQSIEIKARADGFDDKRI